MGRNSEIALAFFAAMNAVTKEAPNKRAVLSFFTPETVFDNIPMDRIVGAEGIWKLLDLGAEAVDWVVHSIAETEDGVVLTERTDRFLIDGTWIEYPVMGSMDFSEDKIVVWRDYFDMKQCVDQTHERARPTKRVSARK